MCCQCSALHCFPQAHCLPVKLHASFSKTEQCHASRWQQLMLQSLGGWGRGHAVIWCCRWAQELPAPHLLSSASGGAYSRVCCRMEGPAAPYRCPMAKGSSAEPKSMMRRCICGTCPCILISILSGFMSLHTGRKPSLFGHALDHATGRHSSPAYEH